MVLADDDDQMANGCSSSARRAFRRTSFGRSNADQNQKYSDEDFLSYCELVDFCHGNSGSDPRPSGNSSQRNFVGHQIEEHPDSVGLKRRNCCKIFHRPELSDDDVEVQFCVHLIEQAGVESIEPRLFLLYLHPVFDADERADIAAVASVSTLQARKMKKSEISQSKSPSELITERIAELGDWRGETLAHVRKLIKEADPKITEEWKWRGVPVWSDSGIVCTGESYKTIVKLTFAKGACIKDPKGIFNSSLDGNVRRAIDLHEGDQLNESAFKEIIRAAVKLNSKGKK